MSLPFVVVSVRPCWLTRSDDGKVKAHARSLASLAALLLYIDINSPHVKGYENAHEWTSRSTRAEQSLTEIGIAHSSARARGSCGVHCPATKYLFDALFCYQVASTASPSVPHGPQVGTRRCSTMCATRLPAESPAEQSETLDLRAVKSKLFFRCHEFDSRLESRL